MPPFCQKIDSRPHVLICLVVRTGSTSHKEGKMASNPSVLTKLASALNRQDDVPNQELAQELADTGNAAGIQELIANLGNPQKDIQSDCIKTLYELGYRKPELIASYVPEFVKLLRSRNNRLVWGGMIALGTIAPLKAADIWPHLDIIISVTES